MKFTEKLGAHLTPEWRQQYISYAGLKKMISDAIESAPLKEITSSSIIYNYYGSFEEEFFVECEKELQKVNTFYSEKLAEASRRYQVLVAVLDDVVVEFRLKRRTATRHHLQQDKNISKRNKNAITSDLKNGFSELYLSLVLLQNYKMLNHTGFKKILKKHDKLLNTNAGEIWFEEHVSSAIFFQNNDLDRLIKDVEQHFTEYLENGDRGQAMKRLRVPPLEEIQDFGTVYRVGLFMGAFVVLLATLLIATFTQRTTMELHSVHGLILFRGPFYVIMYLFLLGINVYGWRRAGVNHILIFEINPRKNLTYSHMLQLHGIFGVIWSLSVLGYIYAEHMHVARYLFPLLLIGIMLAFLLNPLPIFHQNARTWFLRLLVSYIGVVLACNTLLSSFLLFQGRVVAAPFFHVGFADFWFGDQLNSIVACLIDLKYLCCFYISNITWSESFQASECLERDFIGNAIVRSLPAWFRFAQCLRRYRDTGLFHPFLVNAGKYASSFPVIIFATLQSFYKDDYEDSFQNPFMWCYLAAAIFQTCYCYSWDVLRDFGLFKTVSGKHIFLREHIIYPAAFYYFAIIENLIVRFFWVISLILEKKNYVNSHNLDSIAGCLEMIRRYIWNYFRLENEHLFNVGKFRAVRDIFIEPISVRSSMYIQKMMDEEDGVLNRTEVRGATMTENSEDDEYYREQ